MISRGQKSSAREEEEKLEDLRAKLAEAGEELKEKSTCLRSFGRNLMISKKEHLLLYHQQKKSQSAAGAWTREQLVSKT